MKHHTGSCNTKSYSSAIKAPGDAQMQSFSKVLNVQAPTKKNLMQYLFSSEAVRGGLEVIRTPASKDKGVFNYSF